MRHCIEATWLNDRDQFLYPNDGWQQDYEFQTDCLVYTLFHGQNRITSAEGVNHWIPFAEAEVGAQDNMASHFMADFLKEAKFLTSHKIVNAQTSLSFVPGNNGEVGNFASLNEVKNFASLQARAVMDAGRELWRYYHAQPNANPNASFYDIRLHFQGTKTTKSGKEQMNTDSSDPTYTALLATLRAAHRALAAHIEPKVYQYGFLVR